MELGAPAHPEKEQGRSSPELRQGKGRTKVCGTFCTGGKGGALGWDRYALERGKGWVRHTGPQ